MRYWPGCTTNAGWMLKYRESIRRYFGDQPAPSSRGKLEYDKGRRTIVHRPCTCHPSDNPPDPCAKRFALTECREQAFLRRVVDVAWNEATESTAVPATAWADRIIEQARRAFVKNGDEG